MDILKTFAPITEQKFSNSNLNILFKLFEFHFPCK